jgi:hypothetical protein
MDDAHGLNANKKVQVENFRYFQHTLQASFRVALLVLFRR